MADHRVNGEHEPIHAGTSRILPGLFQIAWRHKMLMVIGVAVALVIGVLLHSQARPVYQSSAQVLVIQKKPELKIPGETGGGYADDALGSHLLLIKSPRIVGRAIKIGQLDGLKSFEGMGDATGAIIDGLRVTREKETTSVLTLTFRGPVSEDCPIVLNAILKSYDEYLKVKYQDVSQEIVKHTEDARDLLTKDLDTKEQAHIEFQTKYAAQLKSSGTSVHQDRLQKMEEQRFQAETRKLQITRSIEDLEKAIEENESQDNRMMIVQESLKKLAAEAGKPGPKDDKIFELQLQLDDLLRFYGPGWPSVIALKDTIKRVKSRYELYGMANNTGKDPVEAHLDFLRHALKAADREEKAAAMDLENYQVKAKEFIKIELDEKKMQKDIARFNDMFRSVVSKLDQINLVKKLGGFEADTITYPGSGGQVAPRLTNMIGIAVFLGLLFGMGLSYAAEVTDHSFRTPEEIRNQLGLAVVGHIPYFDETDKASSVHPDAPEMAPMLTSFHQPKSREAESYRGVRTSVLFSRKGGHKVIQVTSPDMGDGKSTLAANLAISIAQSGKRVILIDADLRRPNVHRLFGLDSERGLASVICEEAKLADVIQKTVLPGLSLIPCGPLPSNPAELLSNPLLKEVLDELRIAYDFVIVDTPPLLAITDPCVVVPHVDGVILNIRIGKNSRPHALRAKEILTTLGANILGVVVNEADRNASSTFGYGGGYRYNYGYAYNYGGDQESDPYCSQGVGQVDDADGNGAKPYKNGDEPAPPAPRPRPRPRQQHKKSLLSRLIDRL